MTCCCSGGQGQIERPSTTDGDNKIDILIHEINKSQICK